MSDTVTPVSRPPLVRFGRGWSRSDRAGVPDALLGRGSAGVRGGPLGVPGELSRPRRSALFGGTLSSVTQAWTLGLALGRGLTLGGGLGGLALGGGLGGLTLGGGLRGLGTSKSLV